MDTETVVNVEHLLLLLDCSIACNVMVKLCDYFKNILQTCGNIARFLGRSGGELSDCKTEN